MARTATKEQPKTNDADALTRRHVYQAVETNPPRGMVYEGMSSRPAPEPKYKPFRNLLKRSTIIWDGSDGKPAGRRILRYYDGCTTLFVDEQPIDKETIDGFVANTRPLALVQGEVVVYGYDTMLIKYFDMCSYNRDSPYRIPTVEAIFYKVDSDQIGDIENERLDELETALKFAKETPYKKMVVHGTHLGILEIDLQTQNKLTENSYRALYRAEALANAKEFIRTYTDRSIEVKYWVEKSIENGSISTTMIPNMACWGAKGTPICDISGVKSGSGVVEKIVEFSQMAEGEDFVLQLQALYR